MRLRRRGRSPTGRPSGLFPDHRPEQPHHDEEAGEEGDQAKAAIRRARADVRHQLEDDPEADRPDDEQEREEELRVGVRHPADPAGATFARQRGLQDDEDHQRDDGSTDPEGDRLLEGHEEQLHRSAMLADGTLRDVPPQPAIRGPGSGPRIR